MNGQQPTPRLTDFPGFWDITRRIEDRRAGQSGHLSGTARFSHRPGGDLAYVEQGLLVYGAGPAMTAERRQIWRASPDGIAVHFDDGRFFHAFVPSGGRAEAAHDCPPDRYRVAYDFRRWPHWQSVWEVSGPRKAYRMETSYRPAGAPGAAAR